MLTANVQNTTTFQQAPSFNQGLTDSIAANPLILAADQLLTIPSMLNLDSITPANLELINIEIKKFQQITAHYPTSFARSCLYLLCATIDGNTHGRTQLLQNFNFTEFDFNEFLTTINILCQHPKQYLDLLEFIYVCSKMGFSRYLQHLHIDQVIIDSFMTMLFDKIQQCQQHMDLSLHIEGKQITQTSLLPIVLTCLAILTIFSMMNFIFSNSSNHLFNQLIRSNPHYETLH